MRKEKEILIKAESVETARKMVDNSQSKIEDLEYQLQKAIAEKNEVEIKVEEALQDSGLCGCNIKEQIFTTFALSICFSSLSVTSGRKDIKTEFQTMSSALSKEMGMMEAQLNRWKETAQEAHSLHSEVQSMKALLDRMVLFHAFSN